VASDSHLAVVVPAYNAARFLNPVVRRVLGCCPEVERLFIVDDGSRDDTAHVGAQLAGADGRITVIHRNANGGYGAAMKDGLRAALSAGANTVGCVHADGQYAPEELPRLVAALRTDDLDLLQGSRIASGTALSGGMPSYKYLGNRVLGALGNLALGMGLSDYFSGYLVYGARALEQIPVARLSNSFDFDLEVLACARARGLRVGEAPIPTHYGDEVSYLSPLRYGLRTLHVMWRFRRGHYD
jgi:glycosyltransferase involved in cell wall biosynthesis